MKTLKRIGKITLALFLLLNILVAVHAYHFTHFYEDASLKENQVPCFSCREEIDYIFRNLSSPKRMVIYETAAHQSLYKKEPAKWQATVSEFLSPSKP